MASQLPQSPVSTPPVIIELGPGPPPLEAVRAISHWSDVLLLDSARRQGELGRYSYLMADPIARWQVDRPEFGIDPLRPLETIWQQHRTATIPGLPPFQGGLAGVMGYELGRCWERVPAAAADEFPLPVLAAGWYDWVIAWDHAENRCWLISRGGDGPASGQTGTTAAARAERVVRCLDHSRQRPAAVPPMIARPSLSTESLTPQAAATGLPGLLSDFSPERYLAAVERVIEYIRAGDIFQANLSQRLLYPLARLEPLELYARLRTVNPAPFAGLYLGHDWAILSASPERFLRARDGVVSTRPIKGTRRRPQGAEADLYTQDELRTSEKDVSENVMIVDLLRNDLSRVCSPGSLQVPQLCTIESFQTVQHLVSEVRGNLRPDTTVWDLFRATFPGGSITGAPKVRAMEIIAELEPTVRGPYTGSLFCVGSDGFVDSNLLIRTFVWNRGWLQCGVGGGIVAQSDPVAEYEETWHKAAGMIQALM